MKQENWDSIAKYLAGEQLSEEEMESLELLKRDQELRKIFDESAEVFEKATLYFNHKKFDAEKAWNRLNSQLLPRKKRFTLTRALRIAAIMLLLITSGVVLWQIRSNKTGSLVFATTPFETSNPELILPDGTTVILNHSSTITYPEEFAGNNREITLSGEAFFYVAPNPLKPFIIKTANASITVLGTSFNVFAYHNETTVEVVVKTGQVEMIDRKKDGANTNGKVLLLPGEKGVLDKLNGFIAKEVISNNNNLSWMTHDVEFDYTPLSEVVTTLNRAFNLQIELDENVDQNLRLSAAFSQQKPEYIVDVVAITLGLTVEKSGNNCFTIRKKN
jgi:ferric-dicitrate binding protein FerR (iron transport regulator)